MEKLYTSKTFLKVAGGRMHTPRPTPLDPPLAISYRSHAYFSYLAPLILFFFTKRQSQNGGHGTMPPPKYAPVAIVHLWIYIFDRIKLFKILDLDVQRIVKPVMSRYFKYAVN